MEEVRTCLRESIAYEPFFKDGLSNHTTIVFIRPKGDSSFFDCTAHYYVESYLKRINYPRISIVVSLSLREAGEIPSSSSLTSLSKVYHPQPFLAVEEYFTRPAF